MAYAKTQVIHPNVILTLTGQEAAFLKDYLQNPIVPYNKILHKDERQKIFEALENLELRVTQLQAGPTREPAFSSKS